MNSNYLSTYYQIKKKFNLLTPKISLFIQVSNAIYSNSNKNKYLNVGILLTTFFINKERT